MALRDEKGNEVAQGTKSKSKINGSLQNCYSYFHQKNWMREKNCNLASSRLLLKVQAAKENLYLKKTRAKTSPSHILPKSMTRTAASLTQAMLQLRLKNTLKGGKVTTLRQKTSLIYSKYSIRINLSIIVIIPKLTTTNIHPLLVNHDQIQILPNHEENLCTETID